MNTSIQESKPDLLFQTSDDLVKKKARSASLGKRSVCLTLMPFLAGLIFLFLGIPLARADLLPKNFWVNPDFELGTNLDQTSGTPLGWSQGGSDPTICQITTDNSVSSNHSLAVIDDGASYGEWYPTSFSVVKPIPATCWIFSGMKCITSAVPRCV